MAAGAILKNRKIAISQSRFDRFPQNLARLRCSTRLTVLTVKNVKFRKSAIFGRGSSDFDEIKGRVMLFDPLDRYDR